MAVPLQPPRSKMVTKQLMSYSAAGFLHGKLVSLFVSLPAVSSAVAFDEKFALCRKIKTVLLQ